MKNSFVVVARLVPSTLFSLWSRIVSSISGNSRRVKLFMLSALLILFLFSLGCLIRSKIDGQFMTLHLGLPTHFPKENFILILHVCNGVFLSILILFLLEAYQDISLQYHHHLRNNSFLLALLAMIWLSIAMILLSIELWFLFVEMEWGQLWGWEMMTCCVVEVMEPWPKSEDVIFLGKSLIK